MHWPCGDNGFHCHWHQCPFFFWPHPLYFHFTCSLNQFCSVVDYCVLFFLCFTSSSITEILCSLSSRPHLRCTLNLLALHCCCGTMDSPKCLGKMLGDHMLLGQLWRWSLWSSTEEMKMKYSELAAEFKQGARRLAGLPPSTVECKGLCGQIRNPTSHAAGRTSSQRAIKATGCGYGGGTVLRLQHIFRGSCRGWQGDVPTGRCTA